MNWVKLKLSALTTSLKVSWKVPASRSMLKSFSVGLVASCVTDNAEMESDELLPMSSLPAMSCAELFATFKNVSELPVPMRLDSLIALLSCSVKANSRTGPVVLTTVPPVRASENSGDSSPVS